jgi:hypothetical protein
MLLARRNGGLEKILQTYVEEEVEKGRDIQDEDEPASEHQDNQRKKEKGRIASKNKTSSKASAKASVSTNRVSKPATGRRRTAGKK